MRAPIRLAMNTIRRTDYDGEIERSFPNLLVEINECIVVGLHG